MRTHAARTAADGVRAAKPPVGAVHGLLALQASAGNAAVCELVRRVQRQTQEEFGDLSSPRFAGNALLERTAHDKARVTGGSDPDAVRRVQQALLDAGPVTGHKYDLGKSGPAGDGVDGSYGSKTAGAVKAFKADQSLGFTQFGDVGPRTIHRLDKLFPGTAPPPAPPKPAPPKTFAAFKALMQKRWGVKTIRAGTFDEQSMGDLTKARWKPWKFDDTSPIYPAIAAAFEDLAAAFGGAPPVDEIVFFEVNYRLVDGRAVADSSVGASFDRHRDGVNNLTVYASVVTTNRTPKSRAEKGKHKPAREDTPDPFTGARRNIAHELGHSIEQNVSDIRAGKAGPDPEMMNDFMKTIGWRLGPLALFDSGDRAVQKAFEKDPPDAKVLAGKPQLTADNFELGDWLEQPLTSYMVNSPSEDFGETIMAFINKPELLKARSPRRFKFVEDHKAKWSVRLRKPNP